MIITAFNFIKKWLWAGVTVAMAGLYFLLKHTEMQRDKARAKRDRAEQEIQQQKQKARDQQSLHKAQQESRQKAKDHADKQEPTTERPTGNFGDDRLRDD